MYACCSDDCEDPGRYLYRLAIATNPRIQSHGIVRNNVIIINTQNIFISFYLQLNTTPVATTIAF